MVVCNTSPLVAAALATDDDHHACVKLFTCMHLARRALFVPAMVVAKIGYLLAREAGWVKLLFLAALADSDF